MTENTSSYQKEDKARLHFYNDKLIWPLVIAVLINLAGIFSVKNHPYISALALIISAIFISIIVLKAYHQSLSKIISNDVVKVSIIPIIGLFTLLNWPFSNARANEIIVKAVKFGGDNFPNSLHFLSAIDFFVACLAAMICLILLAGILFLASIQIKGFIGKFYKPFSSTLQPPYLYMAWISIFILIAMGLSTIHDLTTKLANNEIFISNLVYNLDFKPNYICKNLPASASILSSTSEINPPDKTIIITPSGKRYALSIVDCIS